MSALCFAYYCSGHGYGHATRVSAFACHLLAALDPPPTIHIVSSAPEHVFSSCVALGALYRSAPIDPVIVQPLAYRVDRQKSVQVLTSFLDEKDNKLEEERKWLIDIEADCVLSDAAFLGCLAAKAAKLPSVLITNFTFDSVYSYLSTSLVDNPDQLYPPSRLDFGDLTPDTPIPFSVIKPLIEQLHAGYRCADLLVLLPGSIPIPSFSVEPSLPSPAWVDPNSNTFHLEINQHLKQLRSAPTSLYPSLSAGLGRPPRMIMPSPLIVRSPTASPSPYSAVGRSKVLQSLGIPSHLHDPDKTKILIVSFGGQVFRAPSRSGSRSVSRTGSASSQDQSPLVDDLRHDTKEPTPTPPVLNMTNGHEVYLHSPVPTAPYIFPHAKTNGSGPPDLSLLANLIFRPSTITTTPRLATPSHIYIPGAPPASLSPPTSASPSMTFNAYTVPPTPSPSLDYFDTGPQPRLLPDESWIAIVCGVSKEQWDADDDGLPNNFFVAPKYVYMPDLTAVADVLLGKLGYGTVSECVDSCTPFVYVSRPLFIEEHGLRLLLEQEGVGVELSRSAYEAGEWASGVEEAWLRGREAKQDKRLREQVDQTRPDRGMEGREIAKRVGDWVKDWYKPLDKRT